MLKKWLIATLSIVTSHVTAMNGMDNSSNQLSNIISQKHIVDDLHSLLGQKKERLKRVGFLELSQALKEEAYGAINACGLSNSVIALEVAINDKERMEKLTQFSPSLASAAQYSDWSVIGLDAQSQACYLMVFSPQACKVPRLSHTFSLYHELGHVLRGDLEKKGSSRNLYLNAGALLGGITGFLSSSLISKDPKFLAFQTLMISIGGYYLGKAYFNRSNHTKEYAADSFACQKLIAQATITPIVHEFCYHIRNHNTETPRLFSDQTHPGALDRAKNIVHELEKAGYDLLDLPICAVEAKIFNGYLKQYFPYIYAKYLERYT